MHIGSPKIGNEGPFRKSLIGGCSDPDQEGDFFEVFADVPSHMSEAEAIAVLTWSASRREGLTLEEFNGRVLDAASRYFIMSAPPDLKNKGGAPAKDWKSDYGQSARELEFAAVIEHAADPDSTKTSARAKVLRRARPHSNETLAKDADKLKQLSSIRAGKTSARN